MSVDIPITQDKMDPLRDCSNLNIEEIREECRAILEKRFRKTTSNEMMKALFDIVLEEMVKERLYE